MKVITCYLAFFLILMTIVSCSKKDELILQSGQLALPYGQWVDHEGASWLLADSILDSRCPNNPLILCFWEGIAEGFVTVNLAGSVHQIPFQIRGLCEPNPDPCGNALDTLGYHLQFVGLDPYPEEVDAIPQEDYILTLEVKKL